MRAGTPWPRMATACRGAQPVVDALNGVVDHHAIPDRHSY